MIELKLFLEKEENECDALMKVFHSNTNELTSYNVTLCVAIFRLGRVMFRLARV